MELVRLENGRPVTDSLTVADVFGKDHKNVLADIDNQLGKLREAGEEQWGLLNFQHTQYQHPQNKQWYPKYDMTEEAFAIIAMSYVTSDAMKMKVRFLAEFRKMREQLSAGSLPAMSSAEVIAAIANQHVEQERRMLQLEAKQQEAEQAITTIKETFLQRDEDWRNKINGMMKAAAFRKGGIYQDLRRQSYAMLEERGRCDLDKRLRNLVERLEAQGATKTQLLKASRMDVIEAEHRLKEIYTTIVKELSIGTLA